MDVYPKSHFVYNWLKLSMGPFGAVVKDEYMFCPQSTSIYVVLAKDKFLTFTDLAWYHDFLNFVG